MKKILLIPSLTAICLAPIASMVSCNPETPTPPPESWEVTEQEMVDAIKMEGVNYAQFWTSDKFIGYNPYSGNQNFVSETNLETNYVLSPNISHTITQQEDNKPASYFIEEYYDVKQENTFTQYGRELSSNPHWEVTPDKPLDDFATPQFIGSMFYESFESFLDELGCPLLVDKAKKCYTGIVKQIVGDSWSIQTISLYFNEKRLTKMSTSIYETMGEEGYDIATSDLTCTYQNIEPSEPPIVNDVELGDNRVIAETVPALTNTEGFTVDTKNEFRFIIDSSNCTATGWESDKSYLSFFDDEGKLIEDLDFDVVLYSLDTAVFQPGDDGEYEPGHYYYLDDFSDSVLLGVTQQKFGPDSSISSWIDVKFNNHDGEKIYPYWTFNFEI